jgi:hypothetical protein
MSYSSSAYKLSEGSHLGDTGYTFTYYWGMYRIYQATPDGTGQEVAYFIHGHEMWAWAKKNRLPAA